MPNRRGRTIVKEQETDSGVPAVLDVSVSDESGAVQGLERDVLDEMREEVEKDPVAKAAYEKARASLQHFVEPLEDNMVSTEDHLSPEFRERLDAVWSRVHELYDGIPVPNGLNNFLGLAEWALSESGREFWLSKAEQEVANTDG